MRRATGGTDKAREAALVARPVTRIEPATYQQERAARPAPFKSKVTPPVDARAVIPRRPGGSNPEGF